MSLIKTIAEQVISRTISEAPGYYEAKVKKLRIVTLNGGWNKKTYPGIKLEETIVTITKCPDGTWFGSEVVFQPRKEIWTHVSDKRITSRNFEAIANTQLLERGIPEEWKGLNRLTNDEILPPNWITEHSLQA